MMPSKGGFEFDQIELMQIEKSASAGKLSMLGRTGILADVGKV